MKKCIQIFVCVPYFFLSHPMAAWPNPPISLLFRVYAALALNSLFSNSGKILFDFIGFHWISLDFSGFIGFHWISVVLIRFYWISLNFIGFHWISLVFIEFHWISLDFIGFYRFSLTCIGFHCIASLLQLIYFFITTT